MQGLMQGLMQGVVNPMMRWLLTSPLHIVASRWFALIIVTGRRTGREYLIPVNYVREGSSIIIITKRDRTWWKNLLEGAPVSLQLEGSSRQGYGRVLQQSRPDAILAVQRYYRRLLRKGLSLDEAATIADDTVIIEIVLGLVPSLAPQGKKNSEAFDGP